MDIKDRGFKTEKLTESDKALLRRSAIPKLLVPTVGLSALIAGLYINPIEHSLARTIVQVVFTIILLGALVAFYYREYRSFKSGNKLTKTGQVTRKEVRTDVRIAKKSSLNKDGNRAYQIRYHELTIDGYKYNVSRKAFKHIKVGDQVKLSFTDTGPSFMDYEIEKRATQDTESQIDEGQIRVMDLTEEDKALLKKAHKYNNVAGCGCMIFPFALLTFIFGISSGLSAFITVGGVVLSLCSFLLYKYRIMPDLLRKADEKLGKKEVVPAKVIDFYLDNHHYIVTTAGRIRTVSEYYNAVSPGETVLIMRSAKHRMPFGIYVGEKQEVTN